MLLHHRKTAVAALLATLLAACAKEPASSVIVPRPVKVEVVADGTTTASESFIGTLRARQRADLGFESPGRIAAILVDIGDRVRAGQVLARLESSPARWRLEKAEADRASAAAVLAERSTQLRQHESLAKDQIVSATSLESVQTQHQLAVGQLQAAEAALALARRELALVHITAPFDGEIVARAAQPHTDIGAGQPVLQIEAGQTLEVVVMLPDAVASRLKPGQSATAGALQLTLERLSARNENGSLVLTVFRIAGATTGLRSGSVVSVELPRVTAALLSVPALAVLPGTDPGAASVFLLDAAKHQLMRRAIQLGDGVLPGGRLPVKTGLAAGDQVVVAGTAFLTDGQAAVRQEAQTLLDGAQR